MLRKIIVAAIAGLMTVFAFAVPARAEWNDLPDGKVGFWTGSYGFGSLGQYRDPDNGGYWGYVLPDWLDYPNSIWNRSDRYTMYVYNNPTCASYGGRWVRAVYPGQKVNSTPGTDWDSIQAFSYLQPTSSRRSCR